ncbi:MAG: hypothetical protein HUU21_10835 [Polyangiaceae bacterium]|nr:hypothetical protein [Polyangiaceae bacterium]
MLSARSLLQKAAQRPLASALSVAAAAVSIYVAAAPLLAAHYPPITDLPFHGATVSIIRHYFDQSFHFREQFWFDFSQNPYWSLHVLGALFALVAPVVLATKLAAAVLLFMVPAGLALYFHGLKKSPLLGLFGLPLVWTSLSHWGFINFVGAIGLFAGVVGATLLLLDKPTPGRRLLLAASLFLVLVTHIFRFPFAVAAVIGTTIVMLPATRRISPAILPTLPALLLFIAWWVLRKQSPPTDDLGPLNPVFERLREIPDHLFSGLAGRTERNLAKQAVRLGSIAIGLCALLKGIELSRRDMPDKELRFAICGAILSLCLSGAFVLMYVTLPMQMGVWWSVYPREIVPAILMALGLAPNLPKASFLKIPILALIAYAAVAQAAYVARTYASFDAETRDFQEVVAKIPHAPKLGYLVFDRQHPRFTSPAFIHLPAWVQAEKGGWLSFHFVGWDVWPIRYRKYQIGSPSIPPPTPLRFEWMPERFDLNTRGKFFNWFLVRKVGGPDPRFAKQPDLRLVDHTGAFWLYQRVPPPRDPRAP